MLKYEYINKQWIVSPTARRVYRISACLSIALFCGVFALLFEGIPSSYAPLVKALLFAGANQPNQCLHPGVVTDELYSIAFGITYV